MEETIFAGLRHLSLVFSLRALPFALWTVFAPTVRPSHRVCVATAYALVLAYAYAVGAWRMIAGIAVGAAYYLLLSQGADPLAKLVARRRLTRGAAFTVIALCVLFVPGVFAPQLAAASILVFGWELTLRAYSYCVETSRPETVAPTRKQRLFFLFVNPTLVYSDRGTPCPNESTRKRGPARARVGAALLAANVLALGPLLAYLDKTEIAQAALLAPIYGALRVLSEYAAHSGLASLQIGWLAALGWHVRERYERPLAAKSPLEFWRRWNVYVRVWLESYVFVPLSRKLLPRLGRGTSRAVLLTGTFVASGLLHDMIVLAGHQKAALFYTTFFLSAAALALLWSIATAAMRLLWQHLPLPSKRLQEPTFSLLSRMSMAAALVMAALVWG